MRFGTLASVSLVFGGLLASACADDATGPGEAIPRPAFDVTNAGQCGNATLVSLLLSNGRKWGTVEIYNTATELHVHYRLFDRAVAHESHVHAALTPGGIPVANDRAVLRQFDYAAVHSPTASDFEHAIPLAMIPAGTGDDVYVGAQAIVFAMGKWQHAWAAGAALGNSFVAGTAVQFTIQSCGTTPPPPGADIVVFNDVNMLDNTSLANPNNVLMARNLVSFTTSGARNTGTEVLVDCGRSSPGGSIACGGSWSAAHAAWAGEGFTVTFIGSTSDDLDNLITPSAKTIFLITPCTAYTKDEVNALKAFAGQGGRVVFVGEHSGFYGQCIPIENQLLLDLGAVMTNVGNFIDCGYNTLPGTSLRPHQITTGMTDVTMGCSSEIILGPTDFPLYLDLSNTRVLSGVAAIDLTPLTATQARRLAVVGTFSGGPSTAAGN